MKPGYLLAVILISGTSMVQAVDLNKEALKSMQEEGKKIVEESNAGQAYKSSNGLCLDVSGAGLIVAKCGSKSASQKWRLDSKSRLVAHNGNCVDGSQLKKCGGAASQKWKHDGQKRLANNKQCLQTQGNPPKGGAKVTAVACSKAPNQTWK